MDDLEFLNQAMLSALSGFTVRCDLDNRDPDTIAIWAYEYAEALFNERNGRSLYIEMRDKGKN